MTEPKEEARFRPLILTLLLLACYVLPIFIAQKREGVWGLAFGIFVSLPILIVFPLLYRAFRPRNLITAMTTATLAAIICTIVQVIIPGGEAVGGRGWGLFWLFLATSVFYTLVRYSMDAWPKIMEVWSKMTNDFG